MSIRAMSQVWERSGQRGGALLLLLAIADYAHDDGTGAYPTIKKLAEKTRMSESNVHVCMRALTASGELVVHAGEGPRGANLYDVILAEPPERRGADSAPAKSAPSKDCRVQKPAPGGADSSTGGVQNAAAPIRINRHEDPSKEPSNSLGAVAPPPAPDADASVSEKTDAAPPLRLVASPKPNPYGEFIDAVRAADVPYVESGADAKAIKDAPMSLRRHLADAYVAAYRGEWDPGGNGWLRDGLNVRKVVGAINGYLAWHSGTRPRDRPNRKGGGLSFEQLMGGDV